MSIKRGVTMVVGDVVSTHIYEERNVRFQLDDWDIRLQQTTHSTETNGVREADRRSNLRVWLTSPQMKLRGSLFSDGTMNFWEKYTANGAWRTTDADKFEPLISRILAWLKSPEGQRQLIEQTMAKADEEKAELQKRIAEVEAWRCQLDLELEGVL